MVKQIFTSMSTLYGETNFTKLSILYGKTNFYLDVYFIW